MNPPGAASALAAATAYPEIRDFEYYYILTPVMINVRVIIGISLLVGKLLQ